jgi:hypothetical protein
MTLTPFPPEALDELALRLLELAADVRAMANSSRENELEGFVLHGNKVHEWLANLDAWAVDAAGRLDSAVHRQKGVRKALSLTQGEPRTPPRKVPARAKRKSGK